MRPERHRSVVHWFTFHKPCPKSPFKECSQESRGEVTQPRATQQGYESVFQVLPVQPSNVLKESELNHKDLLSLGSWKKQREKERELRDLQRESLSRFTHSFCRLVDPCSLFMKSTCYYRSWRDLDITSWSSRTRKAKRKRERQRN